MSEIDQETIIAALAGEATADEERRLAEWRAGDPRNEETYGRLERLWNATGQLCAEIHAPAPAAGAIIEIADTRSEAPQETPDRRSGPRGPARRSGGPGAWRLVAFAASLILGIGIGAFAFGGDGAEPFGPRALMTGSNEVATVALEDETVVRLAPESRLEFSGDGRSREVTLDGRAYFAVSRRPDQPFRVHLPTGTIEVLGTRFDVESRGDEMRVVVVEGEVRVRTEAGDASVQASQVARAVPRTPPEVQRVDDVFRVIDWLGRFLAFESTPMAQVAEEMEHRFGIRIRIHDAALRERTVTGWFPDQSPEEMLTGICRAVAADCTVRDGTVHMERPGPLAPGGTVDIRSP